MTTESKDLLDVAAASTAFMSMAAWLPPFASLFTIIWLGIRIFESKTVQNLRKRSNFIDRGRRCH